MTNILTEEQLKDLNQAVLDIKDKSVVRNNMENNLDFELYPDKRDIPTVFDIKDIETIKKGIKDSSNIRGIIEKADDKVSDDEDKRNMELINQFSLEPLEKKDVHIRSMFLCNNLVDSHFSRFSLEALEQIKEKVVGQSVIVGHQRGSLPIARFFKAKLVDKDDAIFVRAWFYFSRNTEGADDLAENISSGIYKEVSISFTFGEDDLECSICGENIRGCDHWPGTRYDGQVCHYIMKDVGDVLEGSLVFKGSQVGTSLAGERKINTDVSIGEDSKMSKNKTEDMVDSTYSEEETKMSEKTEVVKVEEIREFQDALETARAEWEKETEEIEAEAEKLSAKLEEAEKSLEEQKVKEEEFAEKLKEQNERLKEAEEQLNQAATEKRSIDIKSFVDELKREGKVTPAFENEVIDVLEHASDVEDIETKADEGEASIKISQRGLIQKMLRNIPTVVAYQELADETNSEVYGDFADPGAEIEQRMADWMTKRNLEATYENREKAFEAVCEENPELAKEYAAK